MARRGMRRFRLPVVVGRGRLTSSSPSADGSPWGDSGGEATRREPASWWRAGQWAVAGGLALSALLLGMVGFTQYFAGAGIRLGFLDAFYRSLQLFVLEFDGIDAPTPAALHAARLLAPLVAGFAAAKALAALFREQLDRWRVRFAWRGHVVVCGLGSEGGTLVRSLLREGRRVAGVDRDPRPGQQAEGMVLLVGDATEGATLRRAGASRAAHVVAVCGADDTNAAVARAARAVAPPSAVIHVHLREARLAALLRTEALADPAGAGRGTLDFFTVDEHAARRLLAAVAFGAGSGGLAVIGLGRFGAAVVVEAARRGAGSAPVPITVVDELASARVADLLHRHPGMEKAAAITAVSLDPASADFDEAAFLVDESGCCRAGVVVVCLEDEGQSLAAALALRQRLKEVTAAEEPVDLVVCTAHASSLAELVGGADAAGGMVRFRTLNPIGASLDASLLTLGTREAIAAALHAAYLASRPPGSPAPPPPGWAGLDEESREANRAAADGIGAGLRSVGCDLVPLVSWEAAPLVFTPAEVELMAILEHHRWVAWKKGRGFRPATVSDPARRTSAHLVPWSSLGEEARELARAFVRSYPLVLAAAGQRVVRLDRSLARTLHECYLARRLAAGETPEANPSLVPWDLLPEHLRASNRDQIAHLRVKLLAVGRDLAPGLDGPSAPLEPGEIERLAEMEHERWCGYQRFTGWSPGPVKDPATRTTPHLVPWEELAEDVRDIDREFARAIPDLVRRMGRRIVRTEQ